MDIIQKAHQSAGRYRENWRKFEEFFELPLEDYWGAVDGFKTEKFGLSIGCGNGDLAAFVGSNYGLEAAELIKRLEEP